MVSRNIIKLRIPLGEFTLREKMAEQYSYLERSVGLVFKQSTNVVRLEKRTAAVCPRQLNTNTTNN